MQMYNTHGQTGETHLINFNGQNWLSGSVTAARHRIEKHGRFNAYFIESLEASNRHVVRRHIWWIRFTYWKNTSFRSGGNSPDIWRFRNGTTMERINLKWQLTRWIRMKLKIKKTNTFEDCRRVYGWIAMISVNLSVCGILAAGLVVTQLFMKSVVGINFNIWKCQAENLIHICRGEKIIARGVSNSE